MSNAPAGGEGTRPAPAAASGAELRARYREVRSRLMQRSAGEPQPSGAALPCAGPARWLDALVDFNECLRAISGLSEALAPSESGHTAARLQSNRIKEVVAAHFGVSVAQLVGRTGDRAHAWPRQIAAYICAREGGNGPSRLGHLFGRDRSTMDHAVRKVAARIAQDEGLASEVERLAARCREDV